MRTILAITLCLFTASACVDEVDESDTSESATSDDDLADIDDAETLPPLVPSRPCNRLQVRCQLPSHDLTPQ